MDKGKILIAEPFAQDPHFKKSVVLVCDTSREDGTVGFILNKVTNLKINELLSDFPDCDATVYYGGPVANDTIHYLHRCGDILDDSREVMPGLYWGGDFKKLKFLIENEMIVEKDIKFFIGYSGWSAGQLEEELDTNSWIISDMDTNYVFGKQIDNLWGMTMHHKGDSFQVLAEMADTFNMN